MQISEAATLCGLTADTIRFYERSGLLPPIHRGPDGRRRFSQENIDWLTLLASLRSTGMPLSKMRQFAALYRAGDQTVPQRRQILLDHSDQLIQRRNALDRCEELLAHKLKLYDEIQGN